MPTFCKIGTIAVHLVGAVFFAVAAIKMFPIIILSAMIFDAPGSEHRLLPWTIFLFVLLSPFIVMFLAISLSALATTAVFSPFARPNRFQIVIYIISTFYLAVVLMSPLHKVVFGTRGADQRIAPKFAPSTERR